MPEENNKIPKHDLIGLNPSDIKANSVSKKRKQPMGPFSGAVLAEEKERQEASDKINNLYEETLGTKRKRDSVRDLIKKKAPFDSMQECHDVPDLGKYGGSSR